MRLALFITLFSCLLAACGPASGRMLDEPPRPDQSGSLQNWSPVDGDDAMIAPDHPALREARSFFVQIERRDVRKAARQALNAQGFRRPNLRAHREIDEDVLRAIDPDPQATAEVLFFSGRMNGQSANAIVVSWYGSFGHTDGQPSNTGVSVFMAPDDDFEALGGFAVPAVRWFGAQVEGNSVRSDGELPPSDQTQLLAGMVQTRIASIYTERAMALMMMGQTMAIHQQTMDMMQSHNNAMLTCAGDSNCSVVPDGSGGWSAEFGPN